MIERDDASHELAGTESGRWASAASSPGEWLVAALGLVVLVATVGLMLYQALALPDLPPELVLHAEEATETAGGYRVGFVAQNNGTRTAANVTVEGRLLSGGETVEASLVTLGFVPGGSQERGGLFFTRDPREHRLEVRALGYEEP